MPRLMSAPPARAAVLVSVAEEIERARAEEAFWRDQALQYRRAHASSKRGMFWANVVNGVALAAVILWLMWRGL